MDWLDRMNAALDYIERNLAGGIDMAAAAWVACCLECHFTRMFSFIAGVPISEYIRRRRLPRRALFAPFQPSAALVMAK